ncbi:hypothetical protein HDV01_002872 [Terramyces sp. JEL0728]|nr:hypothetical protein HDV01_002872 [Terramyces sp. JEL0728]
MTISYQQIFDMAANYVRNSPPRGVELHVASKLYSYYKQATEGDQHREAPWKINVESYAKWSAWKELKGMRKDQAMMKYVELLNQVEPALMVSSFMGIFPEINHVWMTIDNQLYLWNYEVQEPICTHEDPDQVIIHVSLVKPLPGIFLEQIEYLLVIATPLEITLLGIAFEEKKKAGRPRGKVKIFRTDLSCHADSVNMCSIIGTDQGRIFMRGNDGQLFELVYQGEDGWLSRKISMINHSGGRFAVFIPSIFNWAGSDPIKLIALDNARNTLYTVTKNNYIELVYLGPDGKGFTSVAKYRDLNSELSKINAFDDQIVALYPISPIESRSLHVVVITSSGVRAYFSTNEYSYASTTNPKFIEPKTLKCLFAFPPSNIAGAINQRIKVHQGFYSNGITITSQALEDIDRILVSTPHAGTIVQGDRKYLVEYAGYCEVEGRTWAIEEIPSELQTSMKRNPVVGYYLNELATQFEFEARKFYLLTNGGLHTIIKHRPIDILYQLLSSQSPSNMRIFQDFFSKSINQGLYAVSPLGVPFSPNDVAHSAKYNGLVLYISRLVRSLWKRELVSKSVSPNGQELLVPTFTSEQLASIQLNLTSLEAFLKLYPKLTAAPTPDTRPTQGDHEAWKIEQQSFAYIHEIIIRTLETISFLSILIDFKIPNLAQNLSEHDRKELIAITFDGLVILPKGRDVAKALMSALVNNQINKEIGAEYVIDSLQKRCPGICESNDVILFKGMENLRTAKSIANQGSSAQLLQDALK